MKYLFSAANKGHARSSHALSLVLRNNNSNQSKDLLKQAAEQGFLPAILESSSRVDIESLNFEDTTEYLASFLDSIRLGRLLRRDYSKKGNLVKRSHCWNPYCGKWSYDDVNESFKLEEKSNILNSNQHQEFQNITKRSHRLLFHKIKCIGCEKARYCSKFCQVFDLRSGRHKMECRYI